MHVEKGTNREAKTEKIHSRDYTQKEPLLFESYNRYNAKSAHIIEIH